MIFLNRNHEKLWMEETKNVTNHNDLDIPLLILTGMPILYPRLKPFIHPSYIEFQEIIDELRISSGEMYMIELAANLYNGSMSVNFYSLLGRCDKEMRCLAQCALDSKFEQINQ